MYGIHGMWYRLYKETSGRYVVRGPYANGTTTLEGVLDTVNETSIERAAAYFEIVHRIRKVYIRHGLKHIS